MNGDGFVKVSSGARRFEQPTKPLPRKGTERGAHEGLGGQPWRKSQVRGLLFCVRDPCGFRRSSLFRSGGSVGSVGVRCGNRRVYRPTRTLVRGKHRSFHGNQRGQRLLIISSVEELLAFPIDRLFSSHLTTGPYSSIRPPNARTGSMGQRPLQGERRRGILESSLGHDPGGSKRLELFSDPND